MPRIARLDSPGFFAACDGQGGAGVSFAAQCAKVFLKENPGLKERLISTIDK